jgi:hypothetical protein
VRDPKLVDALAEDFVDRRLLGLSERSILAVAHHGHDLGHVASFGRARQPKPCSDRLLAG